MSEERRLPEKKILASWNSEKGINDDGGQVLNQYHVWEFPEKGRILNSFHKRKEGGQP